MKKLERGPCIACGTWTTHKTEMAATPRQKKWKWEFCCVGCENKMPEVQLADLQEIT